MFWCFDIFIFLSFYDTGGLIAIMISIAAIAIVAISYGSLSFPATAITSLSATPLTFANPYPTKITLRMFAYRGPCTAKPLSANPFRMF